MIVVLEVPPYAEPPYPVVAVGMTGLEPEFEKIRLNRLSPPGRDAGSNVPGTWTGANEVPGGTLGAG
ncbi:hypothetical protein RMSM_03084 [Rhodopirellula maiorica SM1]|uniref:Uncharacterized protein n=1 Tax=Rhodopirellula maiorica SM1 TaxID=1265738 RepID=M5RKX8_9BACT|nr:hypothetical protein RMSM_03084 [Rhodopirellula maiorica SM1]